MGHVNDVGRSILKSADVSILPTQKTHDCHIMIKSLVEKFN